MIIRANEIKKLEQLYGQSGNQLVTLYGQVNSEKEQMIRLFCQNKKYFYYRARQASPREQVQQFGVEIEDTYGVRLQKYTYDEYFNRVRSGDPTKLVVVIDEFQYILKKDAAILESLLKLKAKKLYPGPVMIILMSSSVAWMEQDFMGGYEAFRKKIDMEMKLEDVQFLEVVRNFPEYSTRQAVEVYGVIGGVPGYLNRWNGKKDIRENICRYVLSRTGFLFKEAENYISIELRELSVYDTILASIAAGNEKLNDLFLHTGFSRAKISVYLKNLMTFEVVEKVQSFETGGWDNAKKGVYHIRNNFLNFWFHFVYPHQSELYLLTPEQFYDKYIANQLDEYLNPYFITVCREYLSLLNLVKKLPIELHKLGTWVGKQGNIDIVAQNSVRESIVGICNWSRPEMTLEMCRALEKNMKKARISSDYLYLFSAKEFQVQLVEEAARDKRLILIDMKEL